MSSRKRRLFGSVSCLIVSAALLFSAGCRKKQENKATIIFTYGSGIETGQVFRKVVQSFHSQHPEIKVEVLQTQGDYYGKLMTMIAGNTEPDVMWMGQSFSEFASRGAFMDLTSRIEKEVDINKYYKRVADWYRYDGKYYGFPYSVDMDMLFYNKNLFDRAGLPYPNEKWTIKDLVENAQKLTIRDKNGRIQQYGYAGGYDLGPFGADVLNADNTKCTLDRPEAIEALQFTIDLKKKYRVSPIGFSANGEVGGTGMTPDMLFQAGRTAIYRGLTWDLPGFRKKITAFNWDITLIPIAKKRSHWASSGGYAISSQTKNPEEAWIFFKFLISPEAQRITSAITIPVCRDVAEEIIKTHVGPPANLKVFLEAIPYLQSYPRVNNTGAVLEKYNRAAEEAEIGKKTPESAFREAANAINDLLKDNRKRKNSNGPT